MEKKIYIWGGQNRNLKEFEVKMKFQRRLQKAPNPDLTTPPPSLFFSFLLSLLSLLFLISLSLFTHPHSPWLITIARVSPNYTRQLGVFRMWQNHNSQLGSSGSTATWGKLATSSRCLNVVLHPVLTAILGPNLFILAPSSRWYPSFSTKVPRSLVHISV